MLSHNLSSSTILTPSQIDSLNKISAFLAVRDIQSLSKEALFEKYHFESADMLILLGSSLIYPVELAATALKEGIVNKIMLVGGVGHSTHYLYDNMRKYPEYQCIKTANRPEADINKDLLIQFYHVRENDIIVENQSTNCGSNAKNALMTLKEHSIDAHRFILLQDPTMQLRTYASFLHEWRMEDALFINYSPYIPALSLINNEIAVTGVSEDAWPLDRFISLLMGEIPRLQDTVSGYGPKGKGFIAHVDIPDSLLLSYQNLCEDLQEFLKNRS